FSPYTTLFRSALFLLSVRRLGAALGDLLFFLEFRGAVDAVELHVAVRGGDVRVARQGDGGRSGTVVGHTDEDDRVRVGGLFLTRVEHVDLLLAQGIALGVRAGVAAVPAELGRAARTIAGGELAGLGEAPVELADRLIPARADHQHQRGDSGEHQAHRLRADLAGGSIPGGGHALAGG